ncbi:MAG: hypothetical protein Q7U04_14810 [Bacteriovorax sp.]|nr:hypothetical protein [Bacteriovorax sp.]
MKIIILLIALSSLSNVFSSEQKNNETPCSVNQKNPECENYLKNLAAKSPCHEDVQKFCIDKDNKDIGNWTVESMNNCLNKNMKSLSLNCAKSINDKITSKCLEKLPGNCSKYKGNKQIECLAEKQIRVNNNECK